MVCLGRRHGALPATSLGFGRLLGASAAGTPSSGPNLPCETFEPISPAKQVIGRWLWSGRSANVAEISIDSVYHGASQHKISAHPGWLFQETAEADNQFLERERLREREQFLLCGEFQSMVQEETSQACERGHEKTNTHGAKRAHGSHDSLEGG
jgi:hypothetical protein